MNKIIKLFIALACINQVEATDFNIGKLKEIQITEAGNAVFIFPENYWLSKNQCTNGGWIVIDMTMPGGPAMYANALSGYLSNTDVVVRVSENAGDCNSSYDRTDIIRLTK